MSTGGVASREFDGKRRTVRRNRSEAWTFCHRRPLFAVRAFLNLDKRILETSSLPS